MPQIRFSHNYPKLWGQTTAKLIAIEFLDAKEVQKNKDLLEYDTRYDIGLTPDGDMLYDNYHLPKSGELLQLVFIGNKHIPFCTLRPRYYYNKAEKRTVDKMSYYEPKIGEIFDIVINEKGDD